MEPDRTTTANNGLLGLLTAGTLALGGGLAWWPRPAEGASQLDDDPSTDRVAAALQAVDGANRRLRGELTRAARALSGERVELGKISAASLSADVAVLGLPDPAPAVEGEVGRVLVTGATTIVPRGLHEVHVAGSRVELRGPAGEVLATIPLLRELPLSGGGPLGTGGAGVWSSVYASIVHAASIGLTR